MVGVNPKFCSQCGQAVEVGTRFCSNCGRPFVPAGLAVARPTAPTVPEPLPAPTAAAQTATPVHQSYGGGQPASRSGASFWLLLAAAVVVLVGGFWAISSYTNENRPDAAAWPTSVENRFVDSCISTGGNTTYCNCILLNLQNSISLERFVELEQRVLIKGEWPDELIKATSSCLVKSAAGADAAPPVTQPPRPTLSPDQLAGMLDESKRKFIPEFTAQPHRWDIYNDQIMGELLCFVVDFQNVGRADGSPPESEFSLVAPSGAVALQSFRLGADPLASFQQVVPGTKGSFEKCFSSGSERGTFVLRRKDGMFSHDGEWKIAVLSK